MPVCGVDPGGKATGVVVRSGSVLLHHQLVERNRDEALEDYLIDVVRAVDDAVFETAAARVAVEDLVTPSPHMGLTSVRGLLDTAYVIGAIRFAVPGCHMVRPDGHGKVPKQIPPGPQLDAWMAQQYPADLLGPKEIGGAYTGRLRHARSAWDISGVAMSTQMRFGITS